MRTELRHASRRATRALPWALTAIFVSIPVLSLRVVADPSPWLHLSVGRFLLAGQRFGSPDPWAPFATKPYVPTQWLPSMVTSWAYDRWGLAVVVWERAAGIGLLALCLFLWATRIGRPAVAVGAAAIAMFAAWPGLTERPQLLGFVLLIPVLYAWWRTGEDLRPRWWLVPVSWLAACVHGIFATGFVLGGIVVMGLVVERRTSRRQSTQLLALLSSCVVVAGLTPLGPRLLLTPFSVGEQGRQFVSEWLPSSVRSPHVLAVLGMLAVTWWCWARGRGRPALWMVLLSGCAFALAMSMQRTVPVAAFVALPLLVAALESTLVERAWGGSPGTPVSVDLTPRTGRRTAVAATAGTLAGLALAMPVSAAEANTVRGVPSSLEVTLRTLPTGTRVVAPADLTGWLFWASPQLRPVEDIRIESYAPTHVRRYIGAMAAEPGWEAFVSTTGARAALLPDTSPLAEGLSDQLRWRTVAKADGYVVLAART